MRSLPDSKPMEIRFQLVSRTQRLEQVGPLAHGVGAAGRPVGPALVGLARVLLDPFLQPARVLEEHRVVDDHRADAVVVVQVVQLVDDLVHRLAAHVGDVGVLVAEDALPRADAAGEDGRHRPRPPAALRLQRPVELSRAVCRLAGLGHSVRSIIGHSAIDLALSPWKRRGNAAGSLHQVDDHLLARPLADVVELGRPPASRPARRWRACRRPAPCPCGLTSLKSCAALRPDGKV